MAGPHNDSLVVKVAEGSGRERRICEGTMIKGLVLAAIVTVGIGLCVISNDGSSGQRKRRGSGCSRSVASHRSLVRMAARLRPARRLAASGLLVIC